MQSLLMCFYSASDGYTGIEQTLSRQLSCWNPKTETPASGRMVAPLVVPVTAGLGYIARWRSVKRSSGFVFTAGYLYQTMFVKWGNWQPTPITLKPVRTFMESAG